MWSKACEWGILSLHHSKNDINEDPLLIAAKAMTSTIVEYEYFVSK